MNKIPLYFKAFEKVTWNESLSLCTLFKTKCSSGFMIEKKIKMIIHQIIKLK
jgi:hypothetical protein